MNCSQLHGSSWPIASSNGNSPSPFSAAVNCIPWTGFDRGREKRGGEKEEFVVQLPSKEFFGDVKSEREKKWLFLLFSFPEFSPRRYFGLQTRDSRNPIADGTRDSWLMTVRSH